MQKEALRPEYRQNLLRLDQRLHSVSPPPTGRFIHPAEMGANHIESYLTYLAVERRVAAATQNQALNAIVFLYRHVLGQDPGRFNATRAKRSHRVPVVLSVDEVQRLLVQIQGPAQLIAQLMYAGGLRVGEACSLRVKDVDIERRQITIRHGKGAKDRLTLLPEVLTGLLSDHLKHRVHLHEHDLERREGWVELPDAFRTQIAPRSVVDTVAILVCRQSVVAAPRHRPVRAMAYFRLHRPEGR